MICTEHSLSVKSGKKVFVDNCFLISKLAQYVFTMFYLFLFNEFASSELQTYITCHSCINLQPHHC